MTSRGPMRETSVCTELLLKNPTDHTTKATDFIGVQNALDQCINVDNYVTPKQLFHCYMFFLNKRKQL